MRPNFSLFSDWRQALEMFAKWVEEQVRNPEPHVVQLQHENAAELPVPEFDGMLIWDRTNDKLLVSVGGEWKEVPYTP